MDWERLFSKRAVEQGYKLYMSGRVADLAEVKAGEYHALVSDGVDSYDVIIKRGAQAMSTYYCNCLWSLGGGMCSHLAAVMYALDENSPEPIGEIADGESPFPPEENPPLFNLSSITRGLVFKKNDVFEAKRILGENEGVQASYRITHQKGVPELEATGIMTHNGYFRHVRLTMTPDRLTHSSCYCVHSTKSACPHVTALLLKLSEDLKNGAVPDASSESAAELIESLASGGAQRSEGPVQLRCEIGMLTGMFSARLRAGTDRLVICKRPHELFDAVRVRGRFEATQKKTIDFSTAEFDEPSEALFRALKPAIRDAASDWFEVFGAELDALYDVMKQYPELAFQTGDRSVREFTENKINVKATVEDCVSGAGQFIGQQLKIKMPSLFEGEEHYYTVRGGRMTRVSPEQSVGIRRLRQSGIYGGSLFFSRSRLADLHSTVIPFLETFCKVSDDTSKENEKLIPSPRKVVIYLDAADSAPTARLVSAARSETEIFARSDVDALDASENERAATLAALDKLEELGFTPSDGEFVCSDPGETVFALLEGGLDALTDAFEVNSTSAFDRLVTKKKLRIKAGVSVSAGAIDLNLLSDDADLEELAQVLTQYNLKRKYHRLKSGTLVELDESVAQLSELLTFLGKSPKEIASGKLHLPQYRAFYLDAMLRSDDAIESSRDEKFTALIERYSSPGSFEFEPPQSLTGTLRPYQLAGCRWLAMLSDMGFGGILADEMGLGKTLQAICIMLRAKLDGAGGKNIVICPSSLVFNWLSEVETFAPELKAQAIVGVKPDRQQLIDSDADIYITSYDLLKRDVDLYEGIKFEYEFIDEAQYIKNHATAAAKSVKLIDAKHRFALTGTPIENRLSELWSIFDYLMPGYLFSYETFRRKFEIPVIKNGDERLKSKLVGMVSPFILRRVKSDVLPDLPEKLEQIRYCGMDDEQRAVYEAQTAKTIGLIGSETETQFRRGKIQILADLMRLRQICCDPSLIYDDYDGESAKLEMCVELVRNAIESEHRVLLFSQFTSMIDIIKRRLDEEGVEYYVITGQTPKAQRLKLVTAFNEGSVPVFLISLKAGGTGLNLTGADTVIHFDPWWNVAVQDQATDRAHRIGQTSVVTVYKLVVLGTIEEKIVKLQQDKRALADAFLTGAGDDISAMTKEDLIELLK